MKKSGRVAMGGLIAAMSIVVMLAAWFPYLTYALPALAGCLLIPVIIEIGRKQAWLVYGVTAILCFFLCETEAKVLYIVFFGYYVIIKSLLERLRSKPLQWALKFVVFNLAFAVYYLAVTYVFSLDIEGFGDFGKYTLLLFFVLCNVVFFIYDLAVTRVIWMYMSMLHNKMKKFFGE